MLDTFEIVSTSGVVLWSKKYVPVGSNVINSLIRDVFIEERVPGASRTNEAGGAVVSSTYKKEGYILRWTAAKDFGLIFVAVYQSLVHLTWIDKLLENVRILFTKLFSEQLKNPHTSSTPYRQFDSVFEKQILELEPRNDGVAATPARPLSSADISPPTSSGNDNIAGLQRGPQTPIYESTDATPVQTPDGSRPTSPAVNNHLLTGDGKIAGRMSRRARKVGRAATSSPFQSSGDEGSAKKGRGAAKAAKSKRVWDDHGNLMEDDAPSKLNYSEEAPAEGTTTSQPLEEIQQDTWGKKTAKGEFVLKDLDDEVDAILAESKAKKESADATSGIVGSSLGAIGGLFRNVVGGKTLTEEDLVKPLKGMEDHLLKKNVALEAAVRLCESVKKDLVGTKTNSFTSIETTLRASMEKALTRMLTPTTSLDILRSIQTTTSGSNARPYVISIVGVNGVGKSTNLSKLAFFLLQNHYRILIVAADTFRSGAVEQLGVHVRNLKELSKREGGEVDLFQKGYGKDAANIAKDAVVYARENNFQVVLIDTAGRRHNDQRLMSSLEKFGELAQPDKIFMVGEALVGTDSVAQARNFNASFGPKRNLNGFIISKCDTVGDMVGTLVSMVHATGIPVVFLGVGQHYGDLRTLNVRWATNLLMS